MSNSDICLTRFWNELEKEFKEDAIKVLFMTILVSIYPLLAKLGIFFMAPLVIQVNEEKCILQLAEILRGFDDLKVISLSEQPSKIKNYLKEFNYGKIFFSFKKERYTEGNLMEIVSSCENISGNISEISLKIVMTASMIPLKYKDKFAGFLFVNSVTPIVASFRECSLCFIREIINFSIKRTKEIQYGNREQSSCFDESEQVIKTVAAVFKMYLNTLNLSSSEIKEWEIRINDGLEKIEDEWENTGDPEAYRKVFKNALHNISGKFAKVLDRMKVPEEHIEDIEKSLIFDEKYYYISHDFFVKTCESVGIKGNSINYFKEQLANANIIIHEGMKRNYYVAKIDIVTTYGIKKYRMIKILQEKIDKVGKLSLKEEAERQKGSENSGECKTGENTLPEPSDNSTGL